MRLQWRLKAATPVAAVLMAGLLLFFWVSLTLDKSEERRVVLLVAAGGAVAICAALLVGLSLLVDRPLLELQEKIARLREGDLTVRASFASREDEIGDLGRNFNRMVEQLRETREELQRSHHTQMSRAEHLATLGELAAGLAHEIRNPLAGIAGVIEILGRDLPSASPTREVWGEVKQEMEHIQNILNDLLNYARPKPPQFAAADLCGTVRHAVHLARQHVLSRPVQIELQCPGTLPPMEHDAAQIEQMLLNLLLNAIQAIPEQGRVDVAVAGCGEGASITVRDNGRGIPAAQLASIFRPFFTTKGQGTGLGLSLAKRIVEVHEGKIEVTSTVQQGTEFVIHLPGKRSA
jgi:hypothetical protein